MSGILPPAGSIVESYTLLDPVGVAPLEGIRERRVVPMYHLAETQIEPNRPTLRTLTRKTGKNRSFALGRQIYTEKVGRDFERSCLACRPLGRCNYEQRCAHICNWCQPFPPLEKGGRMNASRPNLRFRPMRTLARASRCPTRASWTSVG